MKAVSIICKNRGESDALLDSGRISENGFIDFYVEMFTITEGIFASQHFFTCACE